MTEELMGLPKPRVLAYMRKHKTPDEVLDLLYDALVREERLAKQTRSLKGDLVIAQSKLDRILATIEGRYLY